jgi:hypothetical protein
MGIDENKKSPNNTPSWWRFGLSGFQSFLDQRSIRKDFHLQRLWLNRMLPIFAAHLLITEEKRVLQPGRIDDRWGEMPPKNGTFKTFTRDLLDFDEDCTNI